MFAHAEGGIHQDSPAVAKAGRCCQEERRGEAQDEVLVTSWRVVVDDPPVTALAVPDDPLVHAHNL